MDVHFRLQSDGTLLNKAISNGSNQPQIPEGFPQTSTGQLQFSQMYMNEDLSE